MRPAPSPWKKFLLKISTEEIIGNYMLRRPKHSTIEVVVPKEEEEDIV